MRGTGPQAANFTTAFILTVSLFALWGLGHRLYDSLMPQFAGVFHLDAFERALTDSTYSIVYFVAAIPAALYARRFGYKAAILFGLGSFCVGAFLLYPAAETRIFDYFLFALVIMSCGWLLLEIAANPLAASLGPVETSVQRLNLAQAFFPLGSLAGLYIGRWLITTHLALPTGGPGNSIVHPYIVIGAGILILAYLVGEVRFPAVASERVKGLRSVGGEMRTLLTRPLFLFAIVAQFFSVVALAGTWSIGGRFVANAFPGMPQTALDDVFVVTLAVYGAGRFVGSALMCRIAPDRLLALFAGAAIFLAGVATLSGGPLGAIAVLASSFFLSIMWPTILGLAIRGRGPLMKLGTALICMGGAIGGFAYQMASVAWTFPAVHFAMVLPLVSYGVILAFAHASEKARKMVAHHPT